MKGTCVDCVSYVKKREWCFLFPVRLDHCAHPENMADEFDYIRGKAHTVACYTYNNKGQCEYFIERSK